MLPSKSTIARFALIASGVNRGRMVRKSELSSLVFSSIAREEALTQRAIRDEADSKFLYGRQHFLLGASCPQRVFALKGGNRLNRVSATNRLRSRFRKAEVLDLAFLNQVLHRSRHVFDRHVRVNTVLIEKIDCLDPKPLQRALSDLLDVL